jgi:hypothetical protein
VDSVLIYSQGKRDAWLHLHEFAGFRSCPQCPHEVEEDEEASTPYQSSSLEGEA